MTRALIISFALLACITLRSDAAQDTWAPFVPLVGDGNTLETLQHKITIGDSGLPSQIFIKADRHVLPLELRDQENVADEALNEFGRGSQLRAPLRIEAIAEGQRLPSKVLEAARPAKQSPAACTYDSKIQAGPFQVTLQTTYECDGAMLVRLTYRIDEGQAESLELVMDIRGSVAMAYRGLPSGFDPDAVPASVLNVSLAEDVDRVVWDSTSPWVAGANGAFVKYLFLGTADRGFTWLCDNSSGFILDEQTPMMQIERDELGQTTWRVRLARAEKIPAGERTVHFALMIHPAKPRDTGFRKRQWLDWPEHTMPAADGVERTTLDARERMQNNLAGKDAGGYALGGLANGAFESLGGSLELKGLAGADAISPEKDNVRLYPASLFSAMAGPYRGLTTRLTSNMRSVVRAGANPSYDRQVLGRALTYDIGASIDGFNQPAQYLKIVGILHEFGLFDDDETEVLPSWRNEKLLRYGEPWSGSDAFSTETENPAGRVYVTAYRRRLEMDGRRGYKVLIVILNEGDRPARQGLHILDSERVFGGRNKITTARVLDIMDFSAVPVESDWRRQRIKSQYRGRQGACLLYTSPSPRD